MTDELETLRRRNRELERELALLSDGGTDPRRRALLLAGVEPHKLADAAAAFRPSGNAAKNEWTLDGLTGPVDSLAREWLSTRPWFGTPESEVEVKGDRRPYIEGDRAIFPDGSSLPVDMMDADALLSMAGETPKPKPAEAKPDEADVNEGESDLDRDWRLAGAIPGKRAS